MISGTYILINVMAVEIAHILTLLYIEHYEEVQSVFGSPLLTVL
jgi:hypothetical protein